MYLETVDAPGFNLVYNGIRDTAVTNYILEQPTVAPRTKYRAHLQSKNCGHYSTGIYLSFATGSVPSQIPEAPALVRFDSTTAFTVSWKAPESDGGYPL
jgi:hypothetical protein